MNRKQKIAIIIDICIFASAAICLFFIYRHIEAGLLRNVITGAIALLLLLLVVYEAICWSRSARKRKKRNPEISTLVLLGEDNRPIRIWDLTGKIGLLVGKSSDAYQVDIDLADTDYSSFIDPEHAVINYQDSGWWIQDTSNRNGVSILRKGKELLMGNQSQTKLEPGDIICVAQYTRIAVN